MTVTQFHVGLISEGPLFGQPLVNEASAVNILAVKVKRKISFIETPVENTQREKKVF
jgi:hypothetical protein